MLSVFKKKYSYQDEILEKSNSLVLKSKILNNYKKKFRPIAFASFDKLKIDQWFELGENSKVMLLHKDERKLKFVAKFNTGTLDHHFHPDAIERFILLDGEGTFTVLDETGQKVIKKEVFIEGKIFSVDIGLNHEFFVSKNAITFGELIKINKEDED